MIFTQPTIHHVLYIESDALQIAKYGFMCARPKSIWVSLEDNHERELLDTKLAHLHRRGCIKLYVVSACWHGDDSSVEDMHDELTALDCLPEGGGTA